MTANVGAARCASSRRLPQGDWRALTIQDKLMPLHDALFVETSPGAGEIRALESSASAAETAPAGGADHGSTEEPSTPPCRMRGCHPT